MRHVVTLLLLLFLGSASWTGAYASADLGVAVVAPLDVSASIPFKQEDTSLGQQAVRMTWALLIALAVGVLSIMGLRKLLKRQAGGMHESRLRQIEARRLGTKLTAYLIEADDRGYLVFQSGDQIRVMPHDKKSSSQQEHQSN